MPVSLLRGLHVLERARRVAAVVLREAVPPLARAAGEQRRALHVGLEVDDELDRARRSGARGPRTGRGAGGSARARASCARGCAISLAPSKRVERAEAEQLADAGQVRALLVDPAARRLRRVAPALQAVHRVDGQALVRAVQREELLGGLRDAAVGVEVVAQRVAVARAGDDVRRAPPPVPAGDVLVLVLGELERAVLLRVAARGDGAAARSRRDGGEDRADQHAARSSASRRYGGVPNAQRTRRA